MKKLAILLCCSAPLFAGDLETFLDGRVHFTLRNQACLNLAGDKTPEVVKAMRDSLGISEVQACAGANLRKAGAVNELLSAIKDSDATVRAVAAREMGVMQKPEFLMPLHHAAEDSDILAASNAIEGLVRYEDHSSAPALRELAVKNGVLATLAFNALVNWRDAEVAGIARKLMDSVEPGDQLAGIRAIAMTGDKTDLPRLRELAKDDVNLSAGGRGFGLMPAISISRAAQNAIRAITSGSASGTPAAGSPPVPARAE